LNKKDWIWAVVYIGSIVLFFSLSGTTEAWAFQDDWDDAAFKKKHGDVRAGSLDFYALYAPPGEIRYLPEKSFLNKEVFIYTDHTEYAGYQLPDLQTLPAFDFRLIENDHAGTRQIRFSNSIWNAGDGPLEFRGTVDQQEMTVEVFQVLHTEGVLAEQIPMGNFYYSESHNHWHWFGFSVYQIWSVIEDGTLDELLVESGKVGYCLRDDSLVDEFNVDFFHPEKDNRPTYTACGSRVQGLSVGWVDTYGYNTPGQRLDVTGIPEGIYALRSVADPNGEIVESDKENNEAITYFQLERFRVQVVELPEL
jgi:hypothetical protein